MTFTRRIVRQTILTTRTLSAFPVNRLSSVPGKFIRKNIYTLIRVSPPGWCHPGRPAPSDATACQLSVTARGLLILKTIPNSINKKYQY